MRYLPLLFVLTLLCTCDRAPESVPLPRLGTAAEPVRYADFAELAPLFEQQNDTVYVINFWATWCRPCREEIPYLQQLAEEAADRPLQVVLVSLDTAANAIDRIPAYLQRTAPRPASVILTDPDDAVWGKTIDRVWSGNLPTTIIYRRALRYVYRRNFRTYADLQRALEPLLDGPSDG